jgi:hypothetical protein
MAEELHCAMDVFGSPGADHQDGDDNVKDSARDESKSSEQKEVPLSGRGRAHAAGIRSDERKAVRGATPDHDKAAAWSRWSLVTRRLVASLNRTKATKPTTALATWSSQKVVVGIEE